MLAIDDPDIDRAALARLVRLGLTERQAAIFFHLFEVTRRTGIQPSFRDVRERFGFVSLNAVRLHLNAFVRKGWIEPTIQGARSIRFKRTPSGQPFAGFTLPEDC